MTASGQPERSPLTRAETEAVRLAARGMADKEIAAALGLSPVTVRNQLAAARRKAGCHNRTQLTLWAIHYGVIQTPGAPVWR
jgi:DNA-binding CsgD family transcriptional regulator